MTVLSLNKFQMSLNNNFSVFISIELVISSNIINFDLFNNSRPIFSNWTCPLDKFLPFSLIS